MPDCLVQRDPKCSLRSRSRCRSRRRQRRSVAPRSARRARRSGECSAPPAAVEALGRALGGRHRAPRGGVASANPKGSSLEEFVTQLAGEAALAGVGVLSLERWGRALVVVLEDSPLFAPIVAPLVGAAVEAATGREVVDRAAFARRALGARVLVSSEGAVPGYARGWPRACPGATRSPSFTEADLEQGRHDIQARGAALAHPYARRRAASAAGLAAATAPAPAAPAPVALAPAALSAGGSRLAVRLAARLLRPVAPSLFRPPLVAGPPRSFRPPARAALPPRRSSGRNRQRRPKRPRCRRRRSSK